MQFSQLYDRLIALVQQQIRNGQLTERGLARRAGMSQSHIHNVLHGSRILTQQTADRLLEALGISVADLLVMGGALPRRPPGVEERTGTGR